MQGNFVFIFRKREAAEIVRRETTPVEERADNGERDSHKLFAALKVSFYLREGVGGM